MGKPLVKLRSVETDLKEEEDWRYCLYGKYEATASNRLS